MRSQVEYYIEYDDLAFKETEKPSDAAPRGIEAEERSAQDEPSIGHLAKVIVLLRATALINSEDSVQDEGQDGLESGNQPEAIICQNQEAETYYSPELSTDELVKRNHGLIVSIARECIGWSRSLQLDDLIQEGRIGLLKAIKRYDRQRGFKFSTYATWWIWGTIKRAIANQDRLIRLPVHFFDLMIKYQHTRNRLLRESGGQEPEPQQVVLQMSIDKLSKESLELLLLHQTCFVVSLQDAVYEDNRGSLKRQERLVDPGKTVFELQAEKTRREAVAMAIEALPWDRQELLNFYYYQGLTLKKIGSLYDKRMETIRSHLRNAENMLVMDPPVERRLRKLWASG